MKTLRNHIDMRINRLHFCLILIQSVLNMVEHGQPWSKSGSDQKLFKTYLYTYRSKAYQI